MRPRLEPRGERLAVLAGRGMGIESQAGIRIAARLRSQVRAQPGVGLMIAALRVGLDRSDVLLNRSGLHRLRLLFAARGRAARDLYHRDHGRDDRRSNRTWQPPSQGALTPFMVSLSPSGASPF